MTIPSRTALGALGALLAVAASASGQCHVQTVADPTATFWTGFGESVVLDGDLAIVSKWPDPTITTSNRALVVYERQSADSWAEIQTIVCPDPVGTEYFGHLVGLDGDRLASSAWTGSLPVGEMGSGGIYLFERQDGLFVHLDTLAYFDPLPAPQQRIRQLFADAGRIIYTQREPSDCGHSVRVLDYDQGNWLEEAWITASSPLDVGLFARFVDVDGDQLVCSGSTSDAFHYQRNSSGAWDLAGTADMPSCGEDNPVTAQVAMEGNRMFVMNDDNFDDCGLRIDVFERPGLGAPFDFTTTIADPTVMLTSAFGSQIVATGGRLAVGINNSTSGPPSFTTEGLYLYEFGPSGTAIPTQVLPTWPATNNSSFGQTVAIDGEWLLLGASNDNTTHSGAGSASFWSFDESLCPELLGVPPFRSIGYMNEAAGYDVARRQDLILDAGVAFGGALYLVLGSLSGTAPGIAVDGLVLPLNPDAWFVQTLGAPNLSPLQATFGTLDSDGAALATIQIPAPLDASFSGLTFHHAFVTIDLNPALAVTSVSRPVPFTIVD